MWIGTKIITANTITKESNTFMNITNHPQMVTTKNN